MREILKRTFIPLIIIGTIITAVGSLTFWAAPELLVITPVQKNIINWQWNYYTFDVNKYLNNINTAIAGKNIFSNSIIAYPPTLPTLPDWTNVLSILKYTVNIWIYILNCLFFGINNIILLPVKIIMYPANIITTLLGINTTHFEYIDFVKAIMNLKLTYVIYL